jgi:hypothetical protein
MPRKFALSPEQRAPLLAALAAGSTYRDATGAARIPWRTWCDWSRAVREDRCDDDDVRSLVEDAHATYAKASTMFSARVAIASAKDWKAAAWALEHRGGDPKRRHDERRAKYEAEIARNRAAGTHVETVRHVGELTDDDLRAEAKRLLDGEGAADGSVSRSTH